MFAKFYRYAIHFLSVSTLNISIIKIIDMFRVDRMIYISCKPSSLARDLKLLQEGGYHVEKIACVDMFPNTYHVETICALKRMTSR